MVKGQSSALLRADDESLSAESLPVLNAFREFLEIERRRTRHRIIGLSVFVVVLFIALAVVAGLVARKFWWSVQTDLANQQQTAVQARTLAEETKKVTATALQNVSVTTHNLKADFARERQDLSRKQQELDSRVEDGADEARRMKDVVSALEIENATLSYALLDIKSNWIRAARQEAVQKPAGPRREEPEAREAPSAPIRPEPSMPERAARFSSTVTIPIVLTNFIVPRTVSVRVPAP